MMGLPLLVAVRAPFPASVRRGAGAVHRRRGSPADAFMMMMMMPTIVHIRCSGFSLFSSSPVQASRHLYTKK